MDDQSSTLSKLSRIAFGVYLIALNLALAYVLVRIWPAGSVTEGVVATSLFGPPIAVSEEVRLLLIVLVTGALGSYIHLATSFADYVGNRRFSWSWGWWYMLRPFIGMALAVIVYFVVRGGLVGANGGASGLNPYGVAAVAGLAGMFSRQATDKLQEVFQNLFRTENPPAREDPLDG